MSSPRFPSRLSGDPHPLCRRRFLETLGIAAGALAAGSAGAALAVDAQEQAAPARRRMTIDLVCGAIGVRASQEEAIALAHRHGFESVAPDPEHLADLPDDALATLRTSLREKRLVFGAAGLPVDFRGADARFTEDLAKLTRLAAGLQRAGVTRVGTWISPSHPELTYLRNFRRHAERLGRVAQLLDEHKLRLGLEYVGPKTSWTRGRFPFIHTLAEMQDLIGEIAAATGRKNVGVVLDSWHWYTSGEAAADVRKLRGEDVVAVDLNDAPAGIPVDQQVDSRRELPAATGVIDAPSFLRALVEIGYDGPVRAEPFNAALRALPSEEAVAATAAAMRKAFAALE
jgi:sugar phosphate isomerase/epimerase